MVIKAVIFVPLHVDEVKRWRPDLDNLDNVEPDAGDDVQDEDEHDDELDDLQLGLLTLIDFQFLDEGTEALNTGDLEDLEETELLDRWEDNSNVTVWDR